MSSSPKSASPTCSREENRAAAKRKPGGFPPAAGGGCVAGCGPPRAGFAARAVETARRAASRVARRARGKARTGKEWPSDFPCRMIEPQRAARLIMRQESASRPLAGRALRGAASPARARPSSSPDRPRRKSHARSGIARPRSLRTCSGGTVRLSPRWRKTKARRFPAGLRVGCGGIGSD